MMFQDNIEEVKHIRYGEFRSIPSVWGHIAASGFGPKEDTEYMSSQIKRFLNI